MSSALWLSLLACVRQPPVDSDLPVDTDTGRDTDTDTDTDTDIDRHTGPGWCADGDTATADLVAFDVRAYDTERGCWFETTLQLPCEYWWEAADPDNGCAQNDIVVVHQWDGTCILYGGSCTSQYADPLFDDCGGTTCCPYYNEPYCPN